MSSFAIRAEGLSKRYRLGRRQPGRTTFREAVEQAARAPFRRLFRRHAAPAGRVDGDNKDNAIWALKDVSFEIPHGQVLGIIGRNGAGKSTLLKILSRITEPTEGYADVCGRLASLLEVGTGFHPELTGRENIYLNGAILGMRRSEIARKFDDIVSFAEVARFLDTPVKHYSSGMYMRLAFAVAAHLDPEILLIDEVLAVGDAQFQKRCLGRMGEVARGGRTVLFISHNMNAVEEICQKVMLLEAGRISRVSDNVRDVITDYLFRGSQRADASTWANSGGELENPWFTPLRFYLADKTGRAVTNPVANDQEVWVRIEGRVQTLDPATNAGYALYNEAGQLLYMTVSTDSDEATWPALERGVNGLKSKLPTRLLNEGVYRLELMAGLHCRQWISQPGANAPVLYLTIQGGLSDSPHWLFARSGLLAPVLPWTKD